MRRGVAIIIVLIVLFKIILGVAGYTLSNSYLDYILFAIIILGVFYFFLTLRIPKWLKISTVVVTLGGIGYLGFWFFVLVAMATEDVKVIDKWNYENYEIRLTSRLGFAGPTYYRYDVDRSALFGLVYKDIDQVVVNYNSLKNCIIDFPKTNMTFDKCEVNIIKHFNKTYE